MDLEAIVKAYDIRGIVPTQLHEELATQFGKAFATFVQANTIIIGHDMRLSSPQLAKAFAAGVNAVGKNVQFAGLMPTDAAYFAAGKFNMPVAMFTASHNPPEWNGIKLTNAGAVPIGKESGLLDIKKIVEEQSWTNAETPGSLEEMEVVDTYVEHALSMIDITSVKPLHIAVDAGNGMAGLVMQRVFDRLPCSLEPLYFELDGSMPNHEPNPIDPKNVQDLIAVVKEKKCDLGIAFDGDADRAFFIDEKGGRISSSLITAMIAKNLLQKTPGATIIYNAVCSNIVPETIEANGGTAVKERVGHSYIKKTMKETGAIFAGEHSGHYYFLNNYRADSGLIAALIVIEMISQAGKPLSEILQQFHKYYGIEETNSTVEDINAVIETLKKTYSDATVEEFDGVTFTYPNVTFNVRASNTEPVLRLNLEATSAELRDQKTEEVLAIIRGKKLA